MYKRQPSDWPHLAEANRREFLERTDRGVFSLQAEATLNQARGFRALAGRAAADIEIFTTTTTFAIMQSLRLDRGPSGPVHP